MAGIGIQPRHRRGNLLEALEGCTMACRASSWYQFPTVSSLTGYRIACLVVSAYLAGIKLNNLHATLIYILARHVSSLLSVRVWEDGQRLNFRPTRYLIIGTIRELLGLILHITTANSPDIALVSYFCLLGIQEKWGCFLPLTSSVFHSDWEWV